MPLLRGCGAALAFALLALPLASVASAQATPPPDDEAIDVQLFNYSIGPKSFFSVDNGSVADKNQLALDALVTYLTNPFTVYKTTGPNNDMIGPKLSQVVSSLTVAQLSGAYGVTENLQLGANLPFVFSLSGDGLDPNTGMHSAQGLQVTGLGDLVIEGKYRLWSNESMRLAGIVGTSLPTSFGSDGSRFIGDDLPTARGRFAFTWSQGKLTLGANAGVIFRKPRTIYSSTIGQQLVYGAGAAVAVTDRFNVIGELYGRTGMTSFAVDESPAEAIGGLRVTLARSVAVVVGGGAGLDRAIGAPNARFFISVGYAPDIRDTDGDGIENARDKCPLVPEDKDGFEDEDGCPDDDNDGDRRPDSDDKCPNEAEDIDGFEDDDGCPEPDNDKDGILDLQDKCPNDPEDGKMPYPKDGCPADKRDSDGDGIPDSADTCPLEEEDQDGFEDGDGCPELDNDGDGIPDAADKCPLCPEDKDGFQDDDGCPELDNDHDGIPDAKDACPNEAETINGIKDDDGCPDTGGVETVKLDGDRLVIAKQPTMDKGGLSAAGQIVVNQMSLVMLGHTEITKWLIAIALPKKEDAQRLGDAIKARLAQKGVGNVEILAAAGPAKVGGVVQERADADATPVCPANLQVKPRPETITPKATMGAAKPVAAPPTVPPKPDDKAKQPKSDDKAKKNDDDVDIDMGN